MNESKDLLQSKTFWGMVLTVLAPLVGSLFGMATDEASIEQWAINISELIGVLLAIYGTVKRKSTIGSIAGMKTNS